MFSFYLLHIVQCKTAGRISSEWGQLKRSLFSKCWVSPRLFEQALWQLFPCFIIVMRAGQGTLTQSEHSHMHIMSEQGLFVFFTPRGRCTFAIAKNAAMSHSNGRPSYTRGTAGFTVPLWQTDSWPPARRSEAQRERRSFSAGRSATPARREGDKQT